MKPRHLLVFICAAVSLLSATTYVNQKLYAEEETNTISALVESDGSTITTADGQKWYRVKSFDDNKSYVISVKKTDGTEVLFTGGGEENEYIWHYYRRTMVPSTYSKFSYLSTTSHNLSCIDGKISFSYRESVVSDLFWSTDGNVLTYTENGDAYYLKYDETAESPFSMTADRNEAAEVSVYTNGDTLERCIKTEPCSENYVTEGSGYAAPEFSVTLSDDGIITDNITWNVDGSNYDTDTLTFRADELAGKEAGVHRVCCFIEGHDEDGIIYREKSSDALFVIAKGVIPDSFISFSDVHEEYHLIGNAIETTINRTGGYIPGLIVCTGDLVNGPTPDSDYMLEKYYPLIKPQLGGIDTVFVSGNHDPGKAASEMSVKADLGAAKDLSASGGLIFDGRSDAVKANGTSSLADGNIKVFSINYEAVIHRNTHDGRYYSYDGVIESTEKFLENASKDYNGELILISAHSGLHVLGMEPASVNPSGGRISQWIGENAYNIDRSYDLASLINSYAEKYGMNIIYLFGHDHSRQEAELILTEGNDITSAKSYTEQTYGTLPLKFTYAHSGYLSTVIGSADSNFSFVYKDGDGYSFDLIRTYDSSSKHSEFADRYVPAVKETTAAESSVTGTSTSSDSARIPSTPDTGDNRNIALTVNMVILLTAGAAVLKSGKRK